MRYKLIALLLCGCAICLLGGCSGGTPESGPGDGPPLEPKAMQATQSAKGVQPLKPNP